ncbi:TPA: hypothetical protein NIA63_005499 [Pseudomonas aeruginosa]|nr:hypothetical protein [Pseudomonas aeruginosa]
MNKALDLLREIRPSIPKEALELWCKDRDAFLASHPAVEQAGGDERAACNRWIAEQQLCQGSDISLFTLERNGALVSLHDLLRDAYQAGQDRAALAQPSPAPHPAPDLDFSRPLETENGDPVKWICADVIEYKSARVCVAKDTGLVYSSPYIGLKIRNVMPEQEEAERPEVVARVVHSNPVVLGQCGPLNANDELMTVAQHAASVARWAEMFNRVEQQRDAALASFKNFHRLLCERFGYTHDEKDWQRDQLSLIEHIAAAQAQHSVPEEFIGRLSEFLAQRGATGKALLRELRDMLAAAPVCRLSRSALTDAQMRRLYDSSTETENERLGFAAFARLIRRAEAVHQIAAAPAQGGE